MQQIYEFIANKQAISRVFMLFLCCLLLSTPTFAQSSNARITIHKKKHIGHRGIERSGKTNETVRWLQRVAVEKQTLHRFGVGKSHVGELSHGNPKRYRIYVSAQRKICHHRSTRTESNRNCFHQTYHRTRTG